MVKIMYLFMVREQVNSEFEAMTGNTMSFFPSGSKCISAVYA